MAVSKSGSSSNSSSSESPLFGMKSKVTYDGYEKVKKHGNNDDYNNAGADPGFFSGGGTLVSCSTSTPINHIVLVFFAEYQLY